MTNITSTTGVCCLALFLALKCNVSFPGNTTYETSLGSYFSWQEAAIHPNCIVSPQIAQDVSTAVNLLTATTTTTISTPSTPLAGCQFAVRSGGHASFPGAANIEGGVTIDLSRLSSITLSPPGVGAAARAAALPPTVSVGVGATWGLVYAQLDALRLSVNGGRAASVGVGGLTLGGGISYFGPRYGWTCDSVANLEVVLADGRIVNANPDENPDLLWVLSGGTNNFGIVTRGDLQTFPQGDLWGGQVVRPMQTADEQVVALAAFNDPESYDEFASLITTFAYSGDQDVQVVVNDMQYTKPEANPLVFHALSSMAAVSSTQRITNMSDLAAETEANDANGSRQASATLTKVSSIAALNAAVQAWNASVASVRTIPSIVWGLGLDPLPPLLYERHADANAPGLADRKGKALIIINLTAKWLDVADDDAVDAAARALIEAIKRDVGGLDALDPFLYVNYAAPWQRPVESYRRASVERMRRVQDMYDPGRVFTNTVPGGFKVHQ
ncbi:Uu.00g009470.m01.CDS01 [Anthostomella pinea]|uniref:Uu.00g009470.m01.CDS01 n=1 Tax=Anthostomella pinea TaxID=933095 RepID=A0AAI8YPX8_9PEZI|nr:Uu.00g009470.m01.CDS01 [Anthostomella pinea]